MTVTERWLDAAKRALRIDSDYALAKILGIPQNRISNYRGVQKTRMDDQLAVRIAQICGIAPAVVLGELMAEKSKTPQLRMVWLDVARQAGKAAVLCVAISAALVVADVRSGSALDPHGVELSASLPYSDGGPAMNIMSSGGPVSALDHTAARRVTQRTPQTWFFLFAAFASIALFLRSGARGSIRKNDNQRP